MLPKDFTRTDLKQALLLAIIGAAVGVAISYSAFNGIRISTLVGALFDSQLVYSLNVTPRLIAAATAPACMLGLAGGLLPAIRVARANIPSMLQET